MSGYWYNNIKDSAGSYFTAATVGFKYTSDSLSGSFTETPGTVSRTSFYNITYTLTPITPTGYHWDKTKPFGFASSETATSISDAFNLATNDSISFDGRKNSGNWHFIGTLLEGEQPIYNLTYDLTGCTISPQPSTVDAESNTTFTVTANSGYKVNSDTVVRFIAKDSDGYMTGENYYPDKTVNNDGTISFTLTSEWTSTDGAGGSYELDVIADEATTEQFTFKYTLDNVTVSPQPESVDAGSAVTLTFTPAEGYTIDYIRANFINGDGQLTGDSLTATDNSLVFTAEDTEVTDYVKGIEITASASIPITVAPTYNLENCSVSPQPSSVTKGDTVEFTFTANDGYAFETQPTITYTDSDDESHTETATNGILSVTFENLGSSSTITVNASAVKTTISVKPTYELTNCTISPQPETIAKGESVTFTFTANDGYAFYYGTDYKDNIYVKDSSKHSTNEYDYNSKTQMITVDFSNLSATDTITVHCEANEAVTVPITYELTNCNVDTQPETLTVGNSYTFTFTPYEGYVFETQPSIDQGMINTYDGENNVVTISQVELIDPDSANTYTFTATATALKESALLNYGAALFYKVTGTIMKNISDEAYNSFTEYVDLGKYIASLKQFYVPISYDETAIAIQMGRYTLKTTANQVTSEFITVDCGTIDISGDYSNALDYDSEIEFWLPFVGIVTVNADRVMNKTIGLKYNVSVISGECVAILYDGEVPIAEGSGNASFDIPYGVNDNFNVASKLGIEPYYLIDLTPTVTIRESVALEGIAYNDNHKVTIGDMSGYCEFTDFKLEGFNATSEELERINNLLTNGIII